jgi:hypothetical protein
MLLHLIIAAALLAPGATSSTEATPTASIVCSMVAVEMDATSCGGRAPARSSRPAAILPHAVFHRQLPGHLTTQLRQ